MIKACVTTGSLNRPEYEQPLVKYGNQTNLVKTLVVG